MKVFISYPKEKADAAREVSAFIRSLGVDVWQDNELIGGQQWARELKEAMRASDLVVLICSTETGSRKGVIQREIKEALEIMRDLPFGHIFLVPLRVADIRLPMELSEIQYIDFFRGDWKTGLARVAKKRLEQIDGTSPPQLLEYFAQAERTGGVEFKTFKRGFPGFEADADYFTYRASNEYWEFLNAQIVSDIVGGFYEANSYAISSDREAKQVGFERPMGMSWSRKAQEYFRDGELVSLQFDAWQFFGGAHGTRGVYTKNFGGAENVTLALKEIVGGTAEALAALRSHCLLGLTRVFDGAASEAADYMQMLDRAVDKWEPYSQWLFNRDGVRLWLSMYSGLPYVAGVFDVPVPWSVLKPHIAHNMKSTLFGRFVADT